jgi:hypothetical protein
MSDPTSAPTSPPGEPWVQVTGSPRLHSWLAEQQVSPPHVTRPMALGLKTDEIQRLIAVGKPGSL